MIFKIQMNNTFETPSPLGFLPANPPLRRNGHDYKPKILTPPKKYAQEREPPHHS